MFLGIRRFKADYSVILWATFTYPEIAHFGRNESQAEEDDIVFEVTRYDLSELDRAITEGEVNGFTFFQNGTISRKPDYRRLPSP